jgi:hypothetical protein
MVKACGDDPKVVEQSMAPSTVRDKNCKGTNLNANKQSILLPQMSL